MTTQWKRHYGSKMPANLAGKYLDVKFPGGVKSKEPVLAESVRWDKWHAFATSVMAWRIAELPDTQAVKATSPTFDPLALQAEVNEINGKISQYYADIKSIEENIIALKSERKKIKTVLKQHGFKLCKPTPATSADSDVNLIDMSDAHNWQVGDLIECIDGDIDKIGFVAPITKITNGFIYKHNSNGNETHCSIKSQHKYWKFHSRPVK